MLLASGVTSTYYQTSITLTSGVTYSFKVVARNSVGYSSYSYAIPIIAARPPDAPIQVECNFAITTAY